MNKTPDRTPYKVHVNYFYREEITPYLTRHIQTVHINRMPQQLQDKGVNRRQITKTENDFHHKTSEVYNNISIDKEGS